MLSFSRNHYSPAFANRHSGRTSCKSIAEEEQVTPDQGRLWSFQEVPLPLDSYTLSVSQTVQLPPSIEDGPPITEQLPLPDQKFRVSGPRFALRDPSDIHSVYPAPGQADNAKTLAHVVLNHATIPWEHGLPSVGFNRLPWLAVLTFTEDELVLDEQTYRDVGFVDKSEIPSGHGAVSTKAARLRQSSQIESALSSAGGSDGEHDDDGVSALLLRPDTFRSIFSGFDDTGKPLRTGPVKTFRFAMLAHVKESHVGFTAASYTTAGQNDDDDSSSVQRRYSVIVSARSGPPGISEPTRVISHLVSIEGLEDINLSHEPRFFGLISLHSWEWMCIPENAIDLEAVMIRLGKNVSPLRLANNSVEEDDEAQVWLENKLKAGYVVKPHTTLDGSQTNSLIRGPFIPIESSRDMILPFSLFGEGLTITDESTGFLDVSYKAAWHLGRSLAMAEATLSSSLLRLRGRIHAEAVRRAKVRELESKGHGTMDSRALTRTVTDLLNNVRKAHNTVGLADRRGAANRWARTASEKAGTPAVRLSDVGRFSLTEYLDQISQVTNALFGNESQDEHGETLPAQMIDADAAAIRAWVLDKFFLAGVPLHLLILHGNMLPRESIRTFNVDSKWIDCIVDGSISLANHFARDDDAVRRAIKECINKYLSDVRGEGPGKGTTLQIPRWGFLLRSIAVTAFADLKVEACLDDDTPAGVREVLYMQVLQDDILLCLFDRVPGEQGFNEVRISQPHHQQTFSIGTRLKAERLHVTFRPVPLQGQEPKQRPPPKDWLPRPDGVVELYDWSSRMMRPEVYAAEYVNALDALDEKDTFFVWKDKNDVPSSLLATQLSTPMLQLTLQVESADSSAPGSPPYLERWQKAGAQLYVSPRPDTLPGSDDPKGGDEGEVKPRADPAFVKLPKGSRRDVRLRGTLREEPTELVGDDVLEVVDSPLLDFQPQPERMTFSPSYDPGNTSGTTYAVEPPLNLVFTLQHKADTSCPDKLEIRIPVALGSGMYPPGVDGSQGMLVIPGNAKAPLLPIVEDVDPYQRWSYDIRLAQGWMYAAPESAETGDTLVRRDAGCVMLVITLHPRRASISRIEGSFPDARFHLRQVSVVSHAEKELQAQFDVVCFRRAGLLSEEMYEPISATFLHLAIRRATMLSIQEDSWYDYNTGTLQVRVKPSRTLSTQERVLLRWLPQRSAGEMTQMLQLPSDGSVTVKLDDVPLAVRLVVVPGEDNQTRLGPETESWMLPRLSTDTDLAMLWEDDKLLITWTTPRGDDVPLKISLTVLRGDQETSLSRVVDSSENSTLFTKSELDTAIGNDDQTVWLSEHVESNHPRFRGSLRSRKRAFMKPCRSSPAQLQMARLERDASQQIDANAMLAFLTYSLLDGFSRHEMYWTEGDSIMAALCERKNGKITEAKLRTGVAGLGTATAAFSHKGWESFAMIWITADGGIGSLTRTGHTFPGGWSTTVISPPGSASVINGAGSLAVTNCRVYPTVLCDQVLWWVGRDGEIMSSIWHDFEKQWDKPELAAPAGSIFTGGPTLPKLAVLKEVSPETHSDVLWVNLRGDLMLTRRLAPENGPNFKTFTAVPDANASLYGSMATIVRNHVTWIFYLTDDGSVWGAASSDGAESPWDKFRITPPGYAHPRTQVCAVGHDVDPGLMLFWAHPSGRLYAAQWVDRKDEPRDTWSLRALSPEARAAPGGNLGIAAGSAWIDGMSTMEVFWFGVDQRLQSLSVDMV